MSDMKRIVFVLGLCLALVQQLIAGPVDFNRAKAFASQFIQVEEEALRSVLHKSADEAPAYYIFNAEADKGFVIVSGEDQLPLLIGYSDKGQIDEDNLPLQLQTLLSQYSKRVAVLRKAPKKDGFRSQKVFMHKPKVLVEALTKSKWGQSEPFNELCPEIRDGKRAVTGCVATAVAQMMYYHKWPEKGKGSHSYFPPRYGKVLSSDFSQHTYQWSLMKDEYKAQWVPHPTKPNYVTQKIVYSKEEGEAIGRLLVDVGISVDMDFGIGDSGTTTQSAVSALKKYFDYTVRFMQRSEAEGDDFLSTIKSELEAQRPLVFSGSGTGGGHAWVIDGYDENDYLHCNWGWTGTSDGFFSLNLMSPSALGIGGGSGGYNKGQGVLIAIPNKNGNNNEDTPKELPLAFGGTAGLILEMPNGKDKNSEFLFKLNAYFNYSEENFNSTVGVGIYNPDKSFLAVLAQEDKFIQGSSGGPYSGGLSSFYKNLSAYSDGTYLLRPIFKPNGSDDWEFIKKGNTLTIEIKNGEVTLKNDSHQLRFLHTMSPREDVHIYTNSIGVSTIEVQNLSSKYIESFLGIKLENLATQQTYAKELELVRLSAFGKSVLHPKYKLSDLNVPAGDYSVSFELYFMENVSGTVKEVRRPIENPFGAFLIKVLDSDTLPVLICQDFSVEQKGKDLSTYHLTAELIEQGLFKFKSAIFNKGTIDFNGKLTYRLRNLENQEIIVLGEEKSLSIKASNGVDYVPTAIEVELVQTSTDIDMSSLNLKDGTYRIELIADYNGNKINVWNAQIEPYSFMTEGLAGAVVKKCTVRLAEAKDGGRLRFSVPIDNADFEHRFKLGTEITLVSETAEGYELKEVLLDGVNIYEVGKEITFTLDKDVSLEPIYAQQLIALPELTAEHGTLTYVGHQAGELLAFGTRVTLKAEADEGYELCTLMHNGKDIMANKTFVLVDGNKIEVQFAKTTAVNSLGRSVQVYPNPARGYLVLRGFTPNEELYLLTMTGKTVLSTRLDADGNARVDVSKLPQGLYLIRSKTIVRKLQVQ